MKAHKKYMQQTIKLLESIAESQDAAIEEGAAHLADCLANGHRIYTFGTGHGHLLALEVFYRAGGPVNLCPILDERLMLHISASKSTAWERNEEIAESLLKDYPMAAGDMLIAISNSGRNAVPVLLSDMARARGVYVIALTSMAHSNQVTPRNSLGKRLFEVADLILDNGGVLGDASVCTKRGHMIGATSTVSGAALLQAMLCRAEELASERGQTLDFYASSNIDGGDEINQRYLDKYIGSIKGL
jgi:Uncharacterized protein containing SIS (Sugar ISomerase) phosphosugar binding domain